MWPHWVPCHQGRHWLGCVLIRRPAWGGILSLALVCRDGVFYNVCMFSHRICHRLLIGIKLSQEARIAQRRGHTKMGIIGIRLSAQGPPAAVLVHVTLVHLFVMYDSAVGICHKNLLILLLIIMLGGLFQLLAMSCLIIFTGIIYLGESF